MIQNIRRRSSFLHKFEKKLANRKNLTLHVVDVCSRFQINEKGVKDIYWPMRTAPCRSWQSSCVQRKTFESFVECLPLPIPRWAFNLNVNLNATIALIQGRQKVSRSLLLILLVPQRRVDVGLVLLSRTFTPVPFYRLGGLERQGRERSRRHRVTRLPLCHSSRWRVLVNIILVLRLASPG